MTWSGKRKLYYGGIACIAIALFLFINIYPKLTKDPTCSDGKRNGAEVGTDCGGGCARICAAEAVPLVVKWSRSFKVSEGFYNAFAYIENQNLQRPHGLFTMNLHSTMPTIFSFLHEREPRTFRRMADLVSLNLQLQPAIVSPKTQHLNLRALRSGSK